MSGIESARRALRVLVVDDHHDGAESCGMLLRLHGHEVHIARSCAGAVASADLFTPDVVLMDIGLPDGDGYALAARLAGMYERRPLFVAVTAHIHFEERSREAGFAHHFLKPVEPAVLADLLAGYVPGVD